MNNTKENLLERHIITSNNLKDMIDAYNYGTATPMQWLIGTLKQLRMILLEDQQVTLYDKSGNSKILSKSESIF